MWISQQLSVVVNANTFCLFLFGDDKNEAFGIRLSGEQGRNAEKRDIFLVSSGISHKDLENWVDCEPPFWWLNSQTCLYPLPHQVSKINSLWWSRIRRLREIARMDQYVRNNGWLWGSGDLELLDTCVSWLDLVGATMRSLGIALWNRLVWLVGVSSLVPSRIMSNSELILKWKARLFN